MLTTIMSESSISMPSHSVISQPRSFAQFRLNLQNGRGCGPQERLGPACYKFFAAAAASARWVRQALDLLPSCTQNTHLWHLGELWLGM